MSSPVTPKKTPKTTPQKIQKPILVAPKKNPVPPVEENADTPAPDLNIDKSYLNFQPSGMNLLESPEYPQPLAMAPRTTFENILLERDSFNNIANPNVDYRYNMDLTVDYEVANTTPFAPKNIPTPPSALGDTIPTPPPIKNVTNEVLEASGEIIPPTPVEIQTEMSRADVPIIDMIQMNYSGYSKVVKDYMSSIGKSIGELYTALLKNDVISGIFKDNIKIISILIFVAAGSFVVNAGISAIVVGFILYFVTKNASQLF